MERAKKQPRSGKRTQTPTAPSSSAATSPPDETGVSEEDLMKGPTNAFVIFFTEGLEDARARAGPGRRFRLKEHTREAGLRWKKMDATQREKYETLAKMRRDHIAETTPKAKRKTAPPVFRTRCSPKKLVQLNSTLNGEQIKAVEGLGFGSILLLKCNLLNRDFLARLVHHFNTDTRSLEFGRDRVYQISTADVARALGLSIGTQPVPLECDENHRKHVEDMFVDCEMGVKFTTLEDVMKLGLADAKFKTAYLLFALACFLCPTTKDVAGPRLYPAVFDLSQILSYAWPEFVLDWLVAEVSKFKKRADKDVTNARKSSFPGLGGCLFILMLIYFDRVPMGMSVGNAGDCLIQCWTKELLGERIAKETNVGVQDPIPGQFPQCCLRHPLAIDAYDGVKRRVKEQLQDIIELDNAMMKHYESLGNEGPSTSTLNPSKGYGWSGGPQPEATTRYVRSNLFNNADQSTKAYMESISVDTAGPPKGRHAKVPFAAKFPDLISDARTMKNAGSQLEKIFKEQEKIAHKLEARHIKLKECEEEYNRREKEFKKWEAKIQKERMQLYSEKKTHERAILDKKRADENASRLAEEQARREKEEIAMKLAEEQKRENEDLHRRIVELEKKLDAKHALELALKVFKGSFEDVEVGLKDNVDGEVELENKLDAIQKDLKDKEQEIEDQDCLIQALITKERKSNDELLETRIELINVSSVLLSWVFGRRFEWCTPKAHCINHS